MIFAIIIGLLAFIIFCLGCAVISYGSSVSKQMKGATCYKTEVDGLDKIFYNGNEM